MFPLFSVYIIFKNMKVLNHTWWTAVIEMDRDWRRERSVSEDENERCVRSLRTWKSARRLGDMVLFLFRAQKIEKKCFDMFRFIFFAEVLKIESPKGIGQIDTAQSGCHFAVLAPFWW